MTKNYRRRNRLEGQFAPRLIEMLESPAFRVLSLYARRVMARLEIELAHHGGMDNGKLIVTFDQFAEYGMHRRRVAPAIRELEALGFIEITEIGRAGNADFRRPNKFRITYRHLERANPTHEWRRITEDDAAMIAKGLRRRGSNWVGQYSPKTEIQCPMVEPQLGANGGTTNIDFHGYDGGTTTHGYDGGTTLDNLGVVAGVAAVKLSEPKARPKPEPKAKADAAKDGMVTAAVPPVAVVNGNGAVPPPAVKPDPVSIARADALLDQKIAERDRLHNLRNPSVADDERLRQLVSEIAVLADQIKVAKLMA